MIFVWIALGMLVILWVGANIVWALLKFIWAVAQALVFVITMPWRIATDEEEHDHGA